MSEENKLIVERKKKLNELAKVTKLYPNSFKKNCQAINLIDKQQAGI